MKRKALSIILLLSLIISAASCGSEGRVDDDTQTQESGETTSSEPETTDYLDKYKSTDLGGRVFTIGTLTDSGYPNYVGDELNGDTVNDIQYNRDSFIESTYNTSIEYYVFDSDNAISSGVRTQVLSDDKTIDCIEASMTRTNSQLAADGQLRDLYGIEGLELDAPWWSQSFNREFTINGKLSAVTGPMVFAYYYSPRIIAFNLRVADEYKLGNLYDVVNDGKWTLDYMASTMKSVKADLNGDGVYGEDDMWGASVDEYSAAGFYISAGGTQTSIDKDGKPVFLFDDQKNHSIIEKVASIIGNDEMTQKAEELASRSGTYDIRDKVYTFKNGHALYLGYGAQAIALYLRDMPDDYGILPVPKFDESQENYITFGNAFVPSYISVPLNNGDDELISTILNTMGYISHRDVQPTITSVLLKGKAARDDDSIKMIDLIYEDIVVDINSSYNFASSFNLLRDITMGKKENFSSAWAGIKDSAQTQMEETFDKFAQND